LLLTAYLSTGWAVDTGHLLAAVCSSLGRNILSSVYKETPIRTEVCLKQNYIPPATKTRPSLNLFTIRILGLKKVNSNSHRCTRRDKNALVMGRPNQLVERNLRIDHRSDAIVDKLLTLCNLFNVKVGFHDEKLPAVVGNLVRWTQ
jgi:hypothetical protein